LAGTWQKIVFSAYTTCAFLDGDIDQLLRGRAGHEALEISAHEPAKHGWVSAVFRALSMAMLAARGQYLFGYRNGPHRLLTGR
jgi:hypothetical protein